MKKENYEKLNELWNRAKSELSQKAFLAWAESAYFFLTDHITKTQLKIIENYINIMRTKD